MILDKLETVVKKYVDVFQICVLLLVGAITTVPSVVVVAPSFLQRLYGVTPTDPVQLALLQHRGVFFGIIGGGLILSAFRRSLRETFITIALVAKLFFVGIVYLHPGVTEQLGGIAIIDLVAIVLLLTVLIAQHSVHKADDAKA